MSEESVVQRVCGILHGSESPYPTDHDGCLLAEGHDGPHEFQDPRGQRWLWETDLECNCAHCRRCEGDYCTTYWRKPAKEKSPDHESGGAPE